MYQSRTLKLVANRSKEIILIRWSLISLQNSREKAKVPQYVKPVCLALGACITQTIVAHATARGINLDGIIINLEGDVDLRGFTGISSEVRPGAQGFKADINIK